MCTTTSVKQVLLSYINSPELRGKIAEPLPAKAARDHHRHLVEGMKVGFRRFTEDRHERNMAELFVGERNVQRKMVATGHAEVYQRYAHQYTWTEDE